MVPIPPKRREFYIQQFKEEIKDTTLFKEGRNRRPANASSDDLMTLLLDHAEVLEKLFLL